VSRTIACPVSTVVCEARANTACWASALCSASCSRTFPRSVIATSRPRRKLRHSRLPNSPSGSGARVFPAATALSPCIQELRLPLRTEIQRQLSAAILERTICRIQPLHLPALQRFRMLHAIRGTSFSPRKCKLKQRCSPGSRHGPTSDASIHGAFPRKVSSWPGSPPATFHFARIRCRLPLGDVPCTCPPPRCGSSTLRRKMRGQLVRVQCSNLPSCRDSSLGCWFSDPGAAISVCA